MKNKIEATILKGTRDFLPGDMAKRNRILDTIRAAFRQFGYQQIETPILNRAEAILGKGGDDSQKMAYVFKDYGGRDVALPFDLTMPFARFAATNYQNLPMPFKRFQIQRVWRAENPQRGRLREFYQCDVDIIGTDNPMCEAEIAKLIVTVFDRLKLDSITIRVNSRRLLNEVLADSGVEQDKLTEAIRMIDKLDKIGEEGVISGLEKIGIKKASGIMEILKPAASNEDTLGKLSAYDASELREFLRLCKKFAVDESKLLVDPTLARGLDYYTGITFEVIYPDSKLGTICAGGRYDDLAGLFSKTSLPGVGVSFGFERIVILLEELGLISEEMDNASSLVTVFDEDSLEDSISIYDSLLAEGLFCELYLGSGNLSKQLKFADKKKIPFVIICGPDEKAKGEVLIRRMSNGNEKRLPLSQLAGYLKGFYGEA